MRTQLSLLVILLVTGWSTIAGAATMAGLQVEVGSGVDANVRAEVRATVAETVNSSGNWTFIETAQARSAMNPVVRDCFTTDCLTKAGKATNAEAGLRITFTGEAQIYDWTIDVYDLRSGAQLASKKGACELCGRAEVTREFRTSLASAVTSARLPAKPSKPVATTPTTPKTTPSETDKQDGPPPLDKPVATTEPTGATEDLVMLELSVVPEDTIVMINGKELGVGSTTVSLEDGTYELVFAREGYRGFKETFVVRPGTSRRAYMRVHLSKTDPDAVQVPDEEGPIDRLGRRRVTYGLISLAMGGGLLATGLYLNHLDGRPTCDGGEFADCPTLHDTANGAFLTTFAGSAMITAGAFLLAWELLAGGELSDSGTAVAPSWSERGFGLTVTRRF